jgi:hypothetical protein
MQREFARDLDALARAQHAGIKAAAEGAQREMRDLVARAGLGRKLPQAVRMAMHPKRPPATRPAAEIFPGSKKAARILEAFMNGAVIAGRGGQHLAIPTENVPRIGRGGGTPMTPAQVAAHFGALKSIPTGNPRAPFILAVATIDAKSGGAVRPATRRRRAQGRQERLTAMFVLVREVRLARRIDPDAIAAKWGERIPDFVSRALGR